MKYTLYSEWCGDDARCLIYHTRPEDEPFNLYGCNDGFDLDIYDNLEKAIVQSGFRPDKIEFLEFTEEETKEKDEILSQYEWNVVTGYHKKEKDYELKRI